MASNFPTGVDSFINPQYLKVNGVDFVKAEHVNDLQDAVRNTQLTIIGSGLSMEIGSNNYVPPSADVKTAIEILDTEVFQRESNLQDHLDAVLLTDPIQHHANVISVTATGNLSSNKVQLALEEHQVDIDNIMSGGIVNSVSLDDRYLTATTPATGVSLTLSQDLFVNGNTTLGDSSDTTTINGELNISETADITGTVTLGDDMYMQPGKKIVLDEGTGLSFVSFEADKFQFHSPRDIIVKLDADDAIDGNSETGVFQIKDGLDALLFEVDEDGITSAGGVVAAWANLSQSLGVGALEPLFLDNESMNTQKTSFTVQVDSNNDSAADYFAVTQNGDDGTVDTSVEILLKAKEDEFIAGSHVQKRATAETGYFGLKFYSDNAGGRFQGYGVNFKSKMMTQPSSITLTVDAGASTNYNNLSVTDINEYGFFIECDSLAIGNCEVKGTYETVGN